MKDISVCFYSHLPSFSSKAIPRVSHLVHSCTALNPFPLKWLSDHLRSHGKGVLQKRNSSSPSQQYRNPSNDREPPELRPQAPSSRAASWVPQCLPRLTYTPAPPRPAHSASSGPAHSTGPAPEPDRFFSSRLPFPAVLVAARPKAMAAGGSDPRAGDVEEDASQLIFPKGGTRDSWTPR